MSEALHIVCPHCHTTNRVRADQLGGAPDCGQCKKPRFTGQPAALDETAFEKHLTRNQIPLLEDFFGDVVRAVQQRRWLRFWRTNSAT